MNAKSRFTNQATRSKSAIFAKSSSLILGLVLGAYCELVVAGPTGGEVIKGDADIGNAGSTTTINQHSQRVLLEWQTFNVAADENVIFNQPGSTAVALNRILDQNASEIFGAIDANGRVFLINPNGIIFGETATVNVGSLVASSLDIDYDDFMAGDYDFQALTDGGSGLVVNRGLLQAATGGSITLMGSGVRNEGLIVAELGQVTLAAGGGASLDFDGDGLLFFEITGEVLENTGVLDSAVSNTGEIEANGGQVLLTARAAKDVFSNVVNNDGIIRAQRIDNSGGVIRLIGNGGDVISGGEIDASGGDAVSTGGTVELLGDRVGLLGDGSIDASGDTGGGTVHLGGGFQGSGEQTAEFTKVGPDASITADARVNGDGGEIIVWADDSTWFYGSASVTGGSESGDGGFVEISGAIGLDYDGHVDATAANGELGMLLFDPASITIINGAGPGANDGDVADWDDPNAALGDFVISEQALEAQAATASLTLAATNDITIQDLTDDDTLSLLVPNDGAGGTAGTVNFTAGGTISMEGAGDTIVTGGGNLTITGAVVGLENVDTSGGLDTTGAPVDDEAGGAVYLEATTGALTVGDITTSGGTATAAGQDAGTVTLLGDTVAVGVITATGSAAAAASDADGGAGGAVALTATNVTTPTITLNGDVNTSGGAGDGAGTQGAGGNATLNDDVILAGATAITTVGGAVDGNITFGGTVDATNAFADSLTLTADTGDIAFNGQVGDVGSELGDINIVSADAVTAAANLRAASLTVNAGSFNSGFGVDTSGADNAAGGAVQITTTGDLDVGDITTDGGADIADSQGQNAGNVTLSGQTINLGAITALGSAAETVTNPDGVDGNVLITANGSVVVGGDINVNAGQIDIFVDADEATTNGAESLTINQATLTAATVNLDGNANTQDDSLIVSLAGADTATWTVNGTNSGTLDAGTSTSATFTNFSSLQGGDQADTFDITADFGGSIAGGGNNDIFNIDTGQSGTLSGGDGDDDFIVANTVVVTGTIDGGASATAAGDELNLSAYTTTIATTLTAEGGTDGFDGSVTGVVTNFNNINEVTAGSAADDSLTGADLTSTWTLDTAGAGSVATAGASLTFSDIESVAGGSAVDTFDLTAANWGDVAGGGNNDIFNIDTGQSGTLSGGDGDDDFIVANTVVVTGTIDGGASATAAGDELNLSGYTTTTAVVVAGAGTNGLDGSVTGVVTNFANINEVTAGSAADDSVTGPDGVTNTWGINVADEGSLTTGGQTMAFSAVENLNGGTGADDFTVSGTGSLTGTAAGGGGTNTLAGNDTTNTWALNAASDGSVTNADGAVAFTGMASVAGGSAVDTFDLTAANWGDVAGGGNNDIFNIDTGQSGTLSGGDGDDDFIVANTVQLTGAGTVLAGGAGSDTLNVAAVNGALTVDLTASVAGEGFTGTEATVFTGAVGQFTGIDVVTGSGDETVEGTAADPSTWTQVSYSDGTETLTFSGVATAVGASATDILQGSNSTDPADADTFTVNVDHVDLNNQVDFEGMDELQGLAGNDTFNVNQDFAGTINGGDDGDTFNLAADATVGGIDGGSGGTDDDTLVAAGGTGATTNVWLINSPDGGSLDHGDGAQGPQSFTDIENLTGNDNVDRFTFTDALQGTAAGLGGDDEFNLNDVGSAGTIDGGDGTDTVSYAGRTTGVTVAYDTFTAIESLTGSNFDDTLLGTGDDDTFTVNAPNSGTAQPTAGGEVVGFDSFENLDGLEGSDLFVITGAGTVASVAGGVDAAGDDTDELDVSAADGTVTVNLEANSATPLNGGAADGFSGIESFVGDNSLDELIGPETGTAAAGGAVFTTTGENDGTIDGAITYENFANLRGGDSGNVFNVGHNMTGELITGDGDDRVNLTDGVTLGGAITGSDGTDTLAAVGGGTGNLWTVDNANSGNIDGLSFNGFEVLVGDGAAADVFSFSGAGAMTSVDGGGGAFTDELRVGNANGIVTVNLENSSATPLNVGAAGGFSGIESFVGDNADDVLIGPNGGAEFTTTGENDGTVDSTLAYTNFANLTGGTGGDEFNLGHNVTGNVDAGSGDDTVNLTDGVTVSGTLTGGGGDSDTLAAVGGGAGNTWTVDNPNDGNIDGQAFTSFESLVGDDAAADVFVITGAGTAASIAGGDGAFTDELDVSVADGTVTVNLENSSATPLNGGAADGFSGIESFVGDNSLDVLVGSNGGSVYTTTGENDGTIDGTIAFENFANLTGGTGNDEFNLGHDVTGGIDAGDGDDDFVVGNGVVLTGAIDGGASGADGDQLDMSASTGTLDVVVSGPGAADGMDGSVSGGNVVDFANINVVTAGTAGNDSFTGLDGVTADWIVSGDTGSEYIVGSASLGFENFEVLEGGDGADTFELGGGSQTGDLTINGNAGANAANVAGDLAVGGDLSISGVQSVTDISGGTLSANLLSIVGATLGIGDLGEEVNIDVDDLVITGAGSVYLSDANSIGSMMIDSTGTVAVDADSDMVLLEITASGNVILVSANGDILNGNNDADINSPEVTAGDGDPDSEFEVRLSAENGVVGTADSPLTVSAPNRVNEGIATIFVTATGGKILNPNQALVNTNVAGLDATEAGVSAAVGASVLSALEEIGFINWAGLDPDIRLVDCLEPCIKLPADQLEDEGLAILREPTQMLVIRTVDGIRLVPVFVQTTAYSAGGE